MLEDNLDITIALLSNASFSKFYVFDSINDLLNIQTPENKVNSSVHSTFTENKHSSLTNEKTVNLIVSKPYQDHEEYQKSQLTSKVEDYPKADTYVAYSDAYKNQSDVGRTRPESYEVQPGTIKQQWREPKEMEETYKPKADLSKANFDEYRPSDGYKNVQEGYKFQSEGYKPSNDSSLHRDMLVHDESAAVFNDDSRLNKGALSSNHLTGTEETSKARYEYKTLNEEQREKEFASYRPKSFGFAEKYATDKETFKYEFKTDVGRLKEDRNVEEKPNKSVLYEYSGLGNEAQGDWSKFEQREGDKSFDNKVKSKYGYNYEFSKDEKDSR